MFHCVSTGDPTPTIQWDRNNKVDAFDLHRFKVSYVSYVRSCIFASQQDYRIGTPEVPLTR